MKVYNRNTLLATLFFGGAGLIYNAIYRDGLFQTAWFVIFGILIYQGLKISFTEEGAAKDAENTKRGTRIFQKLFGRFAPVMRFGSLILFGIAAVFVRVLPDRVWVCMCFVFAAFIYEVWLTFIVYREHQKMRLEE